MIAGGGGARGWVGLRSVRNRWLWVGGLKGAWPWRWFWEGAGLKNPG